MNKSHIYRELQKWVNKKMVIGMHIKIPSEFMYIE